MILCFLMKVPLAAFEGQDVVRFLFDDGLGEVSVHGIVKKERPSNRFSLKFDDHLPINTSTPLSRSSSMNSGSALLSVTTQLNSVTEAKKNGALCPSFE